MFFRCFFFQSDLNHRCANDCPMQILLFFFCFIFIYFFNFPTPRKKTTRHINTSISSFNLKHQTLSLKVIMFQTHPSLFYEFFLLLQGYKGFVLFWIYFWPFYFCSLIHPLLFTFLFAPWTKYFLLLAFVF